MKRVLPNAYISRKSIPGATGFNVMNTHSVKLMPNVITKVHTGISCSIQDKALYLRVAPQRGLALRNISVERGVINSDYRGEIIILMRNNGPKPIKIGGRQRIAQLTFERLSVPQLLVSNGLDKTAQEDSTISGTSKPKVTVFRVNNTQSLLISNKRNRRMRARLISTPMVGPLNKNTPMGDQEVMKVAKLDDMVSEKVHPFLNMQFQEPPPQASENLRSSSSPHKTPADTVNTSLPKMMTFTHDPFLQSIGLSAGTSTTIIVTPVVMILPKSILV